MPFNSMLQNSINRRKPHSFPGGGTDARTLLGYIKHIMSATVRENDMNPMKSIYFAVMFGLSASSLAQGPDTARATDGDPWAPIKFMVGKWSGTASGNAGDGTVVRDYDFVLKQRFLYEKNTSTYPPQEKNKRGEIHDHVGYISYDKSRKVLVLRQFHVEGFVNQYVINKEASTPTRLVFESESFENFSNKWKARETYDVISPDEFIETFELAPPDKPFQLYGKNHLKRIVTK